MLRLLLLQLLLLLLLRRRRLLLPPLLPVLLLPEVVKATWSVASAALAATAATALRRSSSRCKGCNMLLEQVLLLCYNHRRLRLLLREEAVRGLARIDGQARGLLIEIATTLSDVLAIVFEEQTAQILDHVVELVYVVDVLLGGALVGIELTGLKSKNTIQHL